MANSHIGGLSGAGALADANLGVVEQSGAAKQTTLSALKTYFRLGLATTDSPQFAGINLGHASDTPVTRTGAGAIAVNGVAVVLGAVATAAEIWAGTAGNKWFSAAVWLTANAPTAVNEGATITLDLNAGINFEVTALTASRTLAFSNYTGKAGRVGHIIILQNGTGGWGLTAGTDVLPSDATSGVIALNNLASEATVIPYVVTAANKIRLG